MISNGRGENEWVKREDEREERRREEEKEIIYTPGKFFFCLPRLTSKNFSFTGRRARDSNEIWRLAPSDSVKSLVANVKLWSHWDECVSSI